MAVCEECHQFMHGAETVAIKKTTNGYLRIWYNSFILLFI
jgi:hypothetical protein